MKKSLSLLLLLGLIFACGDDDSASPTLTDQPPDVVAPKAEVEGPQTSDPAAAPVNTQVTMVNLTVTAMSSLMTGMAANTSGVPTYTGDAWTWSVTDLGVTITVTVTHESDGWYWTVTWDGTNYDHWIAAVGFTSEDGTSGWWKFYAEDSTVVEVSCEWQGGEYSGSMSWYEGDFSAGGILVFQLTWESAIPVGSSEKITIIVPEDFKFVVTENADGSGKLYHYGWNDDTSDWDLDFEAHWNADGSGWYTDYTDDPPTTVTWG